MFSIPEDEYPRHPTYPDKDLVICGGGRCVWEDLEPFCPHIRAGGTHIMAVNDVGMHIPLDIWHWYSNCPRELSNWARARRPGYNTGFKTHALKHASGASKTPAHFMWPFPGHGTSGLNAVYVGLRLGYKQIVLCGIPLDNSGHYFDPHWVQSNFQREVPDKDRSLKWWSNAADNIFEGRVKSMSGRTRELLGAP